MSIKVNNLLLDTIWVERDTNGQPVFYGAHWEGSNSPITCTVVRGSKDIPDLIPKILGPDYTYERLCKHFTKNAVHNFVGWLVKPLAFRVAPNKVNFVD